MQDGYIRVGAATPKIKVADCFGNRDSILDLIRQAASQAVHLVVFPELCLTGYTCSDLFLSQTLLDGARQALQDLVESTKGLETVCVVGLPLVDGSNLYNVAAVFQDGRLLGLVPKTQIPNYAEFYEARHFSPGPLSSQIHLGGQQVEFGRNLLFRCREMSNFCIGVEICEDLWVPHSPSIDHARAGALVVANLSASDEIVAKSAYRRLLVQSHSGRLVCAYVYSDAGEGESSTDLVFAGHNLIYENGRRCAESKLFDNGLLTADIDLQLLGRERVKMNTFSGPPAPEHRVVPFSLTIRGLDLKRTFEPQPFVPSDRQNLAERCDEILSLQSAGLKKRLAHIGCRSAIIGLSGGLDSTLALIVTARAFDSLGLDRKGIFAVTMPGFGTTGRTRQNAVHLAESLGTTLLEVPIGEAVQLHFKDIGQDAETHDVTYENAQARERTQILMDLANKHGGIVIGTGDLSELALGWATYNGDHMSMYAVNASIPKTLVRHLVRYAADQADDALRSTLYDVLDTPVSPELLPPENGEISQKTEHIVGPYELHDFYLYYLVRFGFTPSKVKRLANLAFAGQYTPADIEKWLRVFISRFFAQQFKRSCLPDGPKVGSVTLSPRGDWRMPSDAAVDLWLKF